MAVVNPDHLLDQADRLMTPPRRGGPRQADLRRAISNAYYAVFHALLREAADEFVGSTHRASARYALVYRSVDHKSVRRLCEDIEKETLPAKYGKYSPSGGFGSDLKTFAAVVVDLQEKRHLADYDPLFHVTTSEAALAVATARTTLVRFRSANRTARKALLSLLVFPPR